MILKIYFSKFILFYKVNTFYPVHLFNALLQRYSVI